METAPEGGYAYVWEFHVIPGLESAFERHYGPDGEWSALFRRSTDYIGTLLLKDHLVPGRYLTVDRWRTRGGHETFHSNFLAHYARLDAKFEHLCVRECSLGDFADIPGCDGSGPEAT